MEGMMTLLSHALHHMPDICQCASCTACDLQSVLFSEQSQDHLMSSGRGISTAKTHDWGAQLSQGGICHISTAI